MKTVTVTTATGRVSWFDGVWVSDFAHHARQMSHAEAKATVQMLRKVFPAARVEINKL